jgi:general secretion pathway protein L
MLSRLATLKITSSWDWKAAWIWWRDGLLAWLPVGAHRWLVGSLRRLVIVVEDREWVLTREEDAGRAQDLDRVDGESPDWQVVTEWFKTEKPRQRMLRFPARQALIRTVSLPLAAEKNLRQVAGFEMDRLTPFTASQVYYDVIVLERQSEQRRLRVELTALPRTVVDPILAQLRQRELSPDVLDVIGGRPGLNLLPPEQRVRRGLWGQRLRAAVIGVSLLLVAAAAILPIWQQRQILLETMAKVSQLQQVANQTLSLRDQLDQALEASQLLAQKKQAFPPRVDLLLELTLILPDDTSVERLQINGDNLQIIGQSARASALVGIVESSELFGGASFVSPVTTDPRTGRERFMISARIARES